jgi:O6-methylguanine-DNA--protein-cysteine methyltransferase
MAPGERSEEVHLWYTAVYEAVQEIPHGRVTSYGHIARLLGKREPCPPATLPGRAANMLATFQPNGQGTAQGT